MNKYKLFSIFFLLLALVGCASVHQNNQKPETGWNSKTNIPVIDINSQVIAKNNSYYNESKLVTDKLAKALNKKYQYRIKPGDQVNIIIWGHPDLNNPNNAAIANEPGAVFTVDDAGDIYYPYVGRVHLENRTIANARFHLKTMVAKYIKNPSVNLSVVKFANAHVNVLGAVNKPQRIPLTEVPLSLSDAIGQAEGETEQGNLRSVILKRNDKSYRINLLAKDNSEATRITLQPNDLVYVNRLSETRVYVLGEVYEPRVVWLEDEHLNLAEALSSAKGMNIPRAKKDVYVLRLNAQRKPVAYELNISKPAGLLLASQFKLRPNDVVYVGTRNITVWNDIINQLLPTAQLVENATRSFTNVVRAERDLQQIRNN